jgi:hypothetical protein
LQSGIELLSEANDLERWRDLYGGTILSNLAFATALKGNKTMAKHYLKEYQKTFGD